MLIELMEMLLIKAAVFMLVTVNKMTSRGADVIALTSLLAVCKPWYNVFARRRWNRKHLRRSFDGNDSVVLCKRFTGALTEALMIHVCRRVVADRVRAYTCLVPSQVDHKTGLLLHAWILV